MPDRDEMRAELERLRSDLETMGEEVAQLRAQVGSAQGRIRLGMRSQSRCPDCGCNKLLHSAKVLDRADVGRLPLALGQPSAWSSKGVGEFEVYVCTGCGLTEWYVKGASELAEEHPKLFSVIEGPDAGDAGPYR